MVWVIRSPYHRTIMATPGQAAFSKDKLFNIASVVDWRIVIAVKQSQVNIDNVRENAK